MPTGRFIQYKRYTWEDLKKGVTLEPPKEAMRAYIAAEGGAIRWAYNADEKPTPHTTVGMPLEPGYHEEFDTDLRYLHIWASAQDVVCHVAYFRSA